MGLKTTGRLAALLLVLTLPLQAQAESGGTDSVFEGEPELIAVADFDTDANSLRARRGGSGTRSYGFWTGIGAGFVIGDVEWRDDSGNTRSEGGFFNTYTANITVTGPVTFRVRGIRATEREDGRTPYELAALVGTQFGSSPWYGLIGAGRVRHADNEAPAKAGGLAWEIVLAPGELQGAGFELSFQGMAGREIDFVGFNLGMRFGGTTIR